MGIEKWLGSFFKGIAKAYSAEILLPVKQGLPTQRSKFKLDFSFQTSNVGQKCSSYLGPIICNSFPFELKPTNNINVFKHKIKKNFFQNIQNEEDDIFIYIYTYFYLLLRTFFWNFSALHTKPFF